ncbi:MAG: hypothetical protein AAF218_00870 [Pseudomonadota bacterium]
MEAFTILGVLSALLLAVAFDSTDDSDEETADSVTADTPPEETPNMDLGDIVSPDPMPNPDPNPNPSENDDDAEDQGLVIDISDGTQEVVGTAFDDLVTGDNSTIEGSSFSTFDLGDGDDTVDVSVESARIDGGAGDDNLRVRGRDIVEIDGGPGDDTLDARTDVRLDGGPGDDEINIVSESYNDFGSGVAGTGGDGDDTINVDATGVEASFSTPSFAEFSGGDGNDVFRVAVSEDGASGGPESSEDLNSSQEFAIPGDILAQLETDPNEVLNVGAFRAGDFEPGVDALEVEAVELGDDYTLSSARLEDFGADETAVILRYEGQDRADRDVYILLGATDVSLDDISFVGDVLPEDVFDARDGEDITRTEDGQVFGTQGDDTIIVDATGQLDETLRIEAGDGDDTISGTARAFAGPDGDSTTVILAGAGDDVISLDGPEEGMVDGGDGNDTITLTNLSAASNVNGGDGDDFITASTGGDPVVVQGGDGNDTLQSGAEFPRPAVRASSGTVLLEGGDGDDEIRLVGPGEADTGYVERGAGGNGDDTIIMSSALSSVIFDFGEGQFEVSPDLSISASGGAGADDFIIRFQDASLTGADQPFVLPSGEQASSTSDEIVEVNAVNITDFEPGQDQLLIDSDSTTENGVLAEARLTEDTDFTGNPRTTLILVYENPDQNTIEATVAMEASGVTWDDIAFIGEQMPTLVPAP